MYVGAVISNADSIRWSINSVGGAMVVAEKIEAVTGERSEAVVGASSA